MTTPDFVSAGTRVGSTSAWPATLTIPDTAAPAGVATGDRVLLVLIAARSGAPSWTQTGGLTGWEFCGNKTARPFGLSYQIRCYTRRWATGCLPVTIEPQTSGGTPVSSGDFYHAQVLAFSPSYSYSASFTGGSANGSDTTLDTGSLPGMPGDGVAIALGAIPWANDIGAPLGSLASGFEFGFTEIHRNANDFAVATRDVLDGAGIVGPIWSKGGTNVFNVGISLMFALRFPEPDLIQNGLRWSGLRFNGRGLR